MSRACKQVQRGISGEQQGRFHRDQRDWTLDCSQILEFRHYVITYPRRCELLENEPGWRSARAPWGFAVPAWCQCRDINSTGNSGKCGRPPTSAFPQPGIRENSHGESHGQTVPPPDGKQPFRLAVRTCLGPRSGGDRPHAPRHEVAGAACREKPCRQDLHLLTTRGSPSAGSPALPPELGSSLSAVW